MEVIQSILHFVIFKACPFVILLGILIFVHELGHYLVAVWNGVRVEVFSLGFGKKIWQIKRGHTVYCISIIPLGGYVKMFGDQPGTEVSPEEKSVAFNHKNVWRRISIVLAGPLMNFFFAALVFSFLVGYGEDYRTARFGEIMPATPAANAGIRSDDLIVSIADQPVTTWDDVQAVLNQNIGSTVKMQIKHVGVDEVIEVKAPVVSQANPNPFSPKKNIGAISGADLTSQGTYIGLKPNSLLATLGAEPGDLIESVNGVPVRTWEELTYQIANIEKGTPLEFGVARFESPFESTESKKMNITLATAELSDDISIEGLGIESSELYLASIVNDSPAEKAGLAKGDRVVAIGGKAINEWEDILKIVSNYKGEGELSFDILRGEETKTFAIQPQMTSQMTATGTEDNRFTIGIRPYANIALPERIHVVSRNPIEMITKGVERTVEASYMIGMSFVKLITGDISPKNIGGIISIGQAASDTFRSGVQDFLRMMALVSVNLFILNLLPIPVLDGGHLVFYVVEAIKGSPLSLRKMEIAQQFGILLLMSLMVYSLFNDVLRLFGKL